MASHKEFLIHECCFCTSDNALEYRANGHCVLPRPSGESYQNTEKSGKIKVDYAAFSDPSACRRTARCSARLAADA
jgi:hypothetical protein